MGEYRFEETAPGATLTIDDTEVDAHIILRGTAVGFTVAFDDARNFTTRRMYRFTNHSTQSVAFSNFTGTITATCQPNNVLQATLTDLSIDDGDWNFQQHVAGESSGAGMLTNYDLSEYARGAGRAGGQTLEGGTAASEVLTLSSTHHGTKGKIALGTSRYDEVNDRLGIGEATPTAAIHLKAGLDTAGGAPLKFTDGNVLATPEPGAQEMYKSTLWFTPCDVTLRQSLDGTIFQQTKTVTVANQDAEKTLLGTGRGVTTLPANYFAAAGRGLRVKARGFYSCIGGATPNFVLKVKLTDDAGGNIICATDTCAPRGAITTLAWALEVDFVCYNTGPTGDFWGQGFATIAATTIMADVVEMKKLALAEMDTSDTIDVDVTVDWVTADVGNTITCTNLTIEARD